MRSKTSRGEGLVPRWGGGGAWQNPPSQFAVPSHNSSFSYLGVPAPTGMSECYESMSRTPIRDDVTRPRMCPHSTAPPLVVPAPHSSFRRRPESRGAGRGECSAGACPPLGRRRGVAESAVPIRRTKPQLQLFNTLVCRRQPGWAIGTKMPLNGFRVRQRTPPFVIPAKAGIHALTFRERTPTAIPPPTSTRRPHIVFPAKAPPEPRYGAGIQRGVGGANFHTLVCRPLPA